MNILAQHFILYVRDQESSKTFYEAVLGIKADLHVPGMTEFRLSEHTRLGLMPDDGIARIISPPLPQPSLGRGIPRCELYLLTGDASAMLANALKAGAVSVSTLLDRDWGDKVAYVADPDGHVLAFAERK